MCIDWQLTFNGLTGLSTLLMAVFAGIALSSWRNEFKAKKQFEMYENLLLLIHEINTFLNNLYAIHEKKDFCENELKKFSNELKLYANKISIVKNMELFEHINKLSTDMEPIKYYNKQNEDGGFTVWYEEFISLYLGNKENFRENTNKTISIIINLCSKELEKYYQ